MKSSINQHKYQTFLEIFLFEKLKNCRIIEVQQKLKEKYRFFGNYRLWNYLNQMNIQNGNSYPKKFFCLKVKMKIVLKDLINHCLLC